MQSPSRDRDNTVEETGRLSLVFSDDTEARLAETGIAYAETNSNSNTNPSNVFVEDEPSSVTPISTSTSSPDMTPHDNGIITTSTFAASEEAMESTLSIGIGGGVGNSSKSVEEEYDSDEKEGVPDNQCDDTAKSLPSLDEPGQLDEDTDELLPLQPATLKSLPIEKDNNGSDAKDTNNNNGVDDTATMDDNIDDEITLLPAVVELEKMDDNEAGAGSRRPLLQSTMVSEDANTSTIKHEHNTLLPARDSSSMATTASGVEAEDGVSPVAAPATITNPPGTPCSTGVITSVVVAQSPPLLAATRGLEIAQGDDDDVDARVPMPFAQTALYEAMERADDIVKTSNLKPELEEDNNNEAPMPPAAQIEAFLEEDGSSNSNLEKKPEVAGNVEEDLPMPASQIASRYEEIDVAKKADTHKTHGDTLPFTTPVSRPQEVAEALAEVANMPMENHLGFVRVADEEARVALPVDSGNGGISTTDDAAAAASDNQTNEQPQNVNNEEQTEDDDSSVTDQSIPLHIPNAYLVVDEEDGRNFPSPQPAAAPIIDVYAQPLLPWWKQTRTRALFAIVCLVVIAAAVAIIASFSRNNDTPAAATTVLVAVDTTSPPSTSFAPTAQKTYAPTGTPSSSHAPSASPISCAFTAAYNALRLDLPLNEPLSPRMHVDGRNAMFVSREANTRSIYVVFFYFESTIAGGWTRTDIFIESYEELEEEEGPFDYSLALSGSTALVGFSRKDTETGGVGAGIVHVFEQRKGDGGPSWTKAEEPLLPDDGGEREAHFGHRLVMQGDLAVVGTYGVGTRALYIFQKNTASGYGGGSWRQRLKFDIDYDMAACFLWDDIIATYDWIYAEIHLYRYNQGLNRIMPLQDALVVDSTKREYATFWDQVEATGTSTSAMQMSMSKDHLVYSTAMYNNDNSTWIMKRVFVYEYQKEGAGDGSDQKFIFRQDFNASDYENDYFGWALALHKDVLVLGGDGQTIVFTQTENGNFEERFQFDASLSSVQLSGRNMIAVTYDNEIYSLNFADCVQQMPTQLPSSSVAPSFTPSSLSKLSTSSLGPSMPDTPTYTPTRVPSPLPTFTLGPSVSVAPTHTPTSSSAPTICYDIRIVISMKGFENDETSWEFYQKRSREVILQGGQFQDDAIEEYEAKCIEQDDYVFKITNSGGNGFGECSTCGYYLYVDERFIGGNTAFIDADIVNVRLPLYQRELNDEMVFFNGQPTCIGDFFLGIVTGDNPQGITWVLTNEDGETLFQGGPYSKVFGSYREFACLPDGHFTFTVYNSEDGASPLSTPYFVYVFGIEWDIIILQSSLLSFNTSESTSFVLGV